jgi:hypothetical protein
VTRRPHDPTTLQVYTLEGQLRTERRAREALAVQLVEATRVTVEAAAEARAAEARAARQHCSLAADVRTLQQVRRMERTTRMTSVWLARVTRRGRRIHPREDGDRPDVVQEKEPVLIS